MVWSGYRVEGTTTGSLRSRAGTTRTTSSTSTRTSSPPARRPSDVRFPPQPEHPAGRPHRRGSGGWGAGPTGTPSPPSPRPSTPPARSPSDVRFPHQPEHPAGRPHRGGWCGRSAVPRWGSAGWAAVSRRPPAWGWRPWPKGGQPTPRDEVRTRIIPAFLASYERFEGFGCWAAVETATGQFLGWFHFRPPLSDGDAPVGRDEEGVAEGGRVDLRG